MMVDAAAGSPGAGRTGADALAEALLRHARRPVVFLVTGNQNLPLVDALGRRDVTLVHARHETGAGYMAEGWARSSGEPGIYLVTAGPGLTSALTPLASAWLSEVPVILLSASHPHAQDGMGAFQELEQTRLTRHLCKAAIRCLNGDQVAAVLTWAWQRATDFPPGPVHVELPADVLTAPVARDATLSCSSIPMRYAAAPPAADPGGVLTHRRAKEIFEFLAAAVQPVVLIRPSLARCPAARRLGEHVPVLVVESPRGLRDPAWADCQELVASADRIVLLGPVDFAVDFGQVGSGPARAYPGAGPALLGELAALLDGWPYASGRLGGAVDGLATGALADASLPVHPMAVAAVVGRLISDDDALVIDGGEFCQWIRHGLRARVSQQLVNGKLGAIGGSIPLATGAALAAPGRRHLAFIGDGSFGYYSAEIDTAVRHGALLTVVVGVDGSWGSEWHQQQARFGGRTFGTEIGGPQYSVVARGYGAHGSEVEDAAQFERQLTAALAGSGVSCLSVRIQRTASPAL
jgi:acetolactate synthase-1/2/3 large subunit